MKENGNKSFITKGIIILLCLFFIAGFAWGFNKVMNMEGTMIPSVIKPSATAAPETAKDALDYINSAIAKACESKPAFSHKESFSIKTVDTDGSGELLDTLKYVRENVEDSLDDAYGEVKADFGEGFSDKLLLPEISEADISEFVCAHIYYKCSECTNTSDEPKESCSSCGCDKPYEKKYRTHIYYECSSCGESSEEPLDKCDKCGYMHPYNMKYRDEYTITFVLSGTGEELLKNPAFIKCFGLRTKEDITALCKDEIDGKAEIDAFSSKCNYALIELSINRFTDEITALTYVKNADVSLNVSFIDGYSALGNANINLNAVEKNKYNFTWPSLSLSAQEMSIPLGDTDNLLATLSCSDPTAMSVTWESSDTSIAEVDDEGYIKASKTAGKTTITASFEFQGKVYSDSCEVTVKTAVEELRISKHNLTLNTGETYTLTTKVSPKKATVQTVKWYSANEAVATVDEQGKITAVSPGICEIYALSDDGYYKSTCEVTVE